MRTILPKFIPRAQLGAYWLFIALVLLIGLLSIKGTALRLWSFQVMPRENLGMVIGAVLVASILAASGAAFRRFGWRRALEILPLLVAVYVVSEYLSVVEERLHFITFGFLGAASVNAFGLAWGAVASLVVSVWDEWLQHILPDRVGDWRDVRFNIMASALGYWAAFRLRP